MSDLRQTLHLCNTVLDVGVLPNKGGDIYSITDRASGVDVMFKTPWGWGEPDQMPSPGNTQSEWLSHYPGGWQQLVPNAGAERGRDGVLRGYHGEAAIVAWHVETRAYNAVRLSTTLSTAPLYLTRSLTLRGPVLQVRDTVRNISDRPTEVMWVQHPAFGAPFVDEHSRLDFGATTLISDAEIMGSFLTGDTTFDARPGNTVDGVDLRHMPAAGSGVAVLGTLTDFDSGWCTITSPTAGFGIRLDWDATVFPHAWFWQECNASTGFPWFQRAYVIAIEPANVIHGEPSPGCEERGRTPLLGPGEEWLSDLSLSRIDYSDHADPHK
jgi:hypothetical protein